MSPRLPSKVIGESVLGGKVTRFDKPRGRTSGPSQMYNYLDERMDLAKLLKRPVWVEYPAGEADGTLAQYPMIHSSLDRDSGIELWITDDGEGIGLLGLTEQDRLRVRPDARWVVMIEEHENRVAHQISDSPSREGLIAALRAGLKQASEPD